MIKRDENIRLDGPKCGRHLSCGEVGVSHHHRKTAGIQHERAGDRQPVPQSWGEHGVQHFWSVDGVA